MKKNLIFFLPNFNYGGAGKSITTICKYLDKKKYNINVISLGKNSYKKTLKKYCKNIYELKSKKTFLSFFEIKKILKKYNKNNLLFISNINYANILSLFFLKVLSSYKVVIVERTPLEELDYYYSNLDFIKKYLMKILIFFIYRKADLTIGNSKKTSLDLNKLTKKKGEFIYPILEKKLTKNLIKKKSKIFNILSIGRLSKEKRFEDIIKSIGLINKKFFYLILLGDGNDRERLSEYIKRFKINGKLIPYSNKLEKEYLKKADLFISSSDFEGFPNAVVQAINYGVPVLSTKSHGGINEILINGKGGFFYRKRDIKDLSKKIVFIKNNYQYSIKKTKYAKKNLNIFLVKKIIYKFEKLIDKII